MFTKFVKIRFDLHCEWSGFEPNYRIYINDELFTERTFRIKAPHYYKEMLQVQAPLGRYIMRLEPVAPFNNVFEVSNMYFEYGQGNVLSENTFEII